MSRSFLSYLPSRKIVASLLIATVAVTAHAQYSGLGAESVSPETLKKYAPPALPAEMANKLKKMFDISSPGMGMLSPDKKTLYFTWRVTGQSHVWKIDGPKSFPVQLTSGLDAVTISEVAPNGKFLILSKDVNGEENPGLFKLDLKTGLIEELYRQKKVQVGLSFITDDSEYIYYTANNKKPESYSIYKMKLADKSVETVYDGDGVWGISDEKNNGASLLLYKYLGSKQNEFYEFDAKTKKLTPILGQNEKEEYDISYSANPNEFLVLTNKLGNFKKLYKYNPKAAKPELESITKDLNFDVSGFSIDHKRTRIVYNINRDGYTELQAMSAKNFKPIQIPKFPGADHVFAGKTTRDGQMTMLGIVTSKAPRMGYSYDWASKKLTQWVVPSAPEVDLSKFSVSELMSYQTRDGIKIPMFVRFPEKCKLTINLKTDCPVVVHFHGGPEGQSEPGFSTMAQAFVNEGFIFAEPNVRGSDGYGKAWIAMDNGPLRENVIGDIEDASIWIKNNWTKTNGDKLQVGVMGWSYGGYSTLMAMTRFAGAYEAGVALVGMSNLVSFLNNTAPYRRILRISEYGDPVKDKDALMKLSAVTYLDRVKSPLMIVQGANDPRVPVGEALQIKEALDKKKIPSQLIVFADEGHGSAKKENQILEIGNTLEFFKKHLK
ncbi:MAG: prolyl oligopeptidase family serine peptidase [Bdellovibrio sp.]|nr:prolyl oligopeptidase family serine peptidase [Bdellovibrio sp.]